MPKRITLERLRMERERKGLSMRQLADILHTNHATISRMESGGTGLNADRLIQLADLYGCSIDYLLGRMDKRNS